MSERIDIDIRNDGSIACFYARTPAGLRWLKDNVASEPWQWLGGYILCVEPRDAGDIASGMMTDGLSVAGSHLDEA